MSVDIAPDAIPEELKERDHWLLWDRSNDTPKQPHWRGDFGISWSDPADWHTFEEAYAATQERDSWGVGYVMAAENDNCARGLYGVIDIDGCAEGDHGDPKEWVPSLDVFGESGSYIEWSPSGTGLHIPIVGAETPDWWNDQHFSDDEHEGVEFLTNKFCTFTGDTLRGAGEDVAECGDELENWLIEAYKAVSGSDPTKQQSDKFSSASEGGRANRDEFLDEDDIREALDHIDPNVDYSTWRDIGFALDDFFSSSRTALSVFEDWSRCGSKWDAEAEDRAERIINDASSGGGRTIGTVIHHARQRGWEMPSPSGSAKPMKRPDTDEDSGSDDNDDSWEWVRTLYEDSDTPNRRARRQAGDLILSEYDFATPRDTETLWEYHGPDGVYEKGGEATVDELLAKQLGEHYNMRERSEILAQINAQTYIDREDFNGGEDDRLLCVANGVLDLETRELKEHDPDYYFTRALPVEYDPDAEASYVREFLEDVTRREEDKLTMLEMVGAALWPTYLKGKFLILFGEGANGKSTFFSMLTRFLGREHVSGWDLQDLGENRFATSALVGKYANIGGDMDAVKVQNTGTLKTLTGGDPTMVEEKGKPAFEFVNSATLMFGANRPPVIDEASRAVKRRLVPIRLPKEFTDVEGDGNPDARDADELLKDLTEPGELSGLLNLALDGLDRLRDNGDVSLPESEEERLEYYEQFSDPIKEFAVNCLTNEEGREVEKSVVYEAYKQFCIEEDYTIKGDNVFFRQLRQTTFHLNETRRREGEDRTFYLKDAKFTEAGTEYVPDYALPGTMASPNAAAADGGGDEVAIDDLEPGRHNITAKVAELLDPKPWQQGRGHLVDEQGSILPYVAEGSENPMSAVEEGDKVRIGRAKVETDNDGLLRISVSGVCEVDLVDRDSNQSGLDDGQEDSNDTLVPDDAEDANADAKRLAKWVGDTKKELSKGKVIAIATDRLDETEPSRAEQLIEKAVREGLLCETEDGYAGTL